MHDQYLSPKHYLIIDFEATCCDQGTVARHEMEIIEIGAVMARADDFSCVGEFQSFIRPVRHPALTPFCTQLTSIRRGDVDGAPLFADVIDSFKAWLYAYPEYIFCSWGDYDLKQLHQDCNYHRLPYPISASHLNLKPLIAKQQKLAKRPGLGEAVRLAGLRFVGTAHRGIDDARNIARLLPYIFGDAVF